MDGITIALIIVILLVVIWYRPFGPRANHVIVGAFGALGIGLLLAARTHTYEYVRDADDTDVPEDVHELAHGGMRVTRGNIKGILRAALRNAKNALVAGVSGIAAIGTLGAGGDTVVEVLALMLDAGVYLGELAMIFTTDTNGATISETLRDIYAITFIGGVNGVRDSMMAIRARAGAGASEIFTRLRDIFRRVIDWMLGLFGRVLSALIPDDASVVGWILSESLIAAIGYSAKNVFWLLNSAYNNAVPDAVHAILQYPERMRDTIVTVLELIRKYVNSSSDDSWAAWAMKHVGRHGAVMAATGAIAVVGAIVLPVVLIPMAAILAIGGTILNVALSAGIGRAQLDAILRALYTVEFNVPGVGPMTAVDSLVALVQKSIPLTFAAMFVLSDYEVVSATETTTDVIEIDPQLQVDLTGVVPKVTTDVSASKGKPVEHERELPEVYAEAFNAQNTQPLEDVLAAIPASGP